jgi:alpha-tubulin suppressor-like RCC1 family protein
MVISTLWEAMRVGDLVFPPEMSNLLLHHVLLKSFPDIKLSKCPVDGAILQLLLVYYFHSSYTLESGELFTWGLGSDGQLGIGSINDHHSPQLVTYLNPITGKTLNVNTIDVDCGARHTAAVIGNSTFMCITL